MQNANVLKQKRSNKIKRGKGESVFMWIMFALFLFYALSVILPFLWMIMNSLKSNGEFFENWNSFPSRLKFENYADAFEKINYNDTNLIGMFFNSVILTRRRASVSQSFSVRKMEKTKKTCANA